MAEATGAGGSTPAPGLEQGVTTPAFRRLWWSWTVSLLGDGVRGLALPLYVATQTRSPLAVSAVAVAEVLPWLLFALPAGAIVDRSRPKIVVGVAHVVRAVTTAALVVCIVTGNATVPVLCAFAFVLTVAETFAYSASQALMVTLAGPDHLNEANSKFYMVHSVGVNLAGPIAAGMLFLVGPAWAFALDGLTFVIAAALVVGLPSTEAPVRPDGPRRLGGDVFEGVRLLLTTSGLRVLVLTVAIFTLAISAVNTMLPLYALEGVGLSPALVSSVLVAGALGTILGSRVVVPVARRFPAGFVLVGSAAVVAVGSAGLGWIASIVVLLVANALVGMGVGAFNVLAAARRQRLTPTFAMGRISGAYRMVAWGLMPIGAGVAGPLAHSTTIGTVFVVAGGAMLIALAVLGRWLVRDDTEAAATTGAGPRTGTSAQVVDGPQDGEAGTDGDGPRPGDAGPVPAPVTDTASGPALDTPATALPSRTTTSPASSAGSSADGHEDDHHDHRDDRADSSRRS